MQAVLARCGVLVAFDKALFDACMRIDKLDGQLKWNWFRIGFDATGKLGTLCFTCNDNKAHAIGAVLGNPFGNFIKHCKSRGHREARAQAEAEADAFMGTPAGNGLTRRINP